MFGDTLERIPFSPGAKHSENRTPVYFIVSYRCDIAAAAAGCSKSGILQPRGIDNSCKKRRPCCV